MERMCSQSACSSPSTGLLSVDPGLAERSPCVDKPNRAVYNAKIIVAEVPRTATLGERATEGGKGGVVPMRNER